MTAARPAVARRVAALAVLLVLNVAYAVALPEILAATSARTAPHGLREETSPVVDAGAVFTRVDAGVAHRRAPWGDAPSYPAVIGGGLAAGDYDGDARIDLYFPPGGPGFPAALYRNLGNLTFADVTAAAGLALDGWGAGAGFADYDDDGDADLYVLLDGEGRLFANGGGSFVDVTQAAGVSLAGACGPRPCTPSSVAWLDYDRDGDLDVYVVNNLDWRSPGLHTSGASYSSTVYFAPRQSSVLFANRGDGTFADVTDAARAENTGKGLGVTTLDVDRDGWTDLATANDVTENALYRNARDGTFENVARRLGANEVKNSMGVAAGDVDGDGRADLAVTNFRGDKVSLLLAGADGAYRYATTERGLGATWRGTGWGVLLFDYDLDGDLDLAQAVGRAVPLAPHERDLNYLLFPHLREDAEDQLFRNAGSGSFAEATASAGDFPDGANTRAILAADLDGDGDLDVVRTHVDGAPADVLRNDLAAGPRALVLDLVGTASPRDAWGARVVADVAGRAVTRELASASGYQTGQPHDLVLGLGGAAAARLRVHWPSGLVEDFGPLAAGRHRLTEGTGAPVG